MTEKEIRNQALNDLFSEIGGSDILVQYVPKKGHKIWAITVYEDLFNIIERMKKE